MTAPNEPHVHDHAHDRGRAHAHTPHPPARPDTDDTLTYYKTMEIAVRELLIEKGIITADEVRGAIEAMDARSPAQGARIVARAWTDPAYKARLLADPNAAIKELGIEPGVYKLVVLENTATVHNLVVCTLCSCYPRGVLGLPPDWYKSRAYRSRAVREPRAVLREFGTDISDSVEVRVHDSTADMRYLVLPERPAGTEGMSETKLAELVTRDSMIGVARARLRSSTMAVNPQQATVGGHALPPDVLQSIRSASSTTGVDFKFLVAQASLESGFQTDVKSKRSSAAGLFQFTSQTWLEMMREHGAKYGQADLAREIVTQASGKLGASSKAIEKRILDLRKDVSLSAQMAAELTRSNATQLEKALRRKPSAADLHLSMLLGATGAVRFLKAHQSNGTTAAAALLPAAARQNPTIFYDNGHTPKTVAAVYRRIAQSIAGPMRQVAALEHAEISHTATVPPATAGTDIPLKPGLGLIASVAPTPIDRKS